MAKWLVKELSQLTHISVQTLHHYDRINLLKPSLRLDNGYRVYSEKDLLKLQQIIALKFFGFSLTQIKKLLAAEINTLDHFATQAQILDEKAKSLSSASNVLKETIATCKRNKSIPWENIIKLIEVYHMTNELEKTWAGKVFTPDELKQYAQFEHGLKTKYTVEDEMQSKDSWMKLVDKINTNLKQNPMGPVGITLGKEVLDWVNNLYGKQYAGLRAAVWNKGFKTGQMGNDHQLSVEAVEWLDKAFHAYHHNRIETFLKSVGKQNNIEVEKNWDKLVLEFCGVDEKLKKKLINHILENPETSDLAKKWINNHA